jgi:hypothetical protein
MGIGTEGTRNYRWINMHLFFCIIRSTVVSKSLTSIDILPPPCPSTNILKFGKQCLVFPSLIHQNSWHKELKPLNFLFQTVYININTFPHISRQRSFVFSERFKLNLVTSENKTRTYTLSLCALVWAIPGTEVFFSNESPFVRTEQVSRFLFSTVVFDPCALGILQLFAFLVIY